MVFVMFLFSFAPFLFVWLSAFISVRTYFSLSFCSEDEKVKGEKVPRVKKLIRTLSHKDAGHSNKSPRSHSQASDHSPRTPRSPRVTATATTSSTTTTAESTTTPHALNLNLMARSDKLTGEKSPRSGGASLRDLKAKLSPRGHTKEEREREREAAALVVSFPVGRPETMHIIEDKGDVLHDAYRPTTQLAAATTTTTTTTTQATTTTTTTATSTVNAMEEEKKVTNKSKSHVGGSTASHSSSSSSSTQEKDEKNENVTATTTATTTRDEEANHVASVDAVPQSPRETGLAPSSPRDRTNEPVHEPRVWYAEKPSEMNNIPKWRNEIQIHISSTTSSSRYVARGGLLFGFGFLIVFFFRFFVFFFGFFFFWFFFFFRFVFFFVFF
jgi:hypothetical protein